MALSSIAIDQFRDFFSNEYQALTPKLANTMMSYKGIVGKSYQIPVAGEITLQDKGAPHSDIPPTIPSYSRPVVTFLNKIANVPSDIFEQAEVKDVETTKAKLEKAVEALDEE